MLPLLGFAADGREHPLREARENLASLLGLSAYERAQLLPSGRQPVFDNRVAWAKTYLQQAGLLSSPRRGYFQITERGRGILAERPEKTPSNISTVCGSKLNILSLRITNDRTTNRTSPDR